MSEANPTIPSKQLLEALMQVALLEAKQIAVALAEIVAYLQKSEHLAALGTFRGIEEQLKLLETALSAAARI